jgi:hypothetical protein
MSEVQTRKPEKLDPKLSALLLGGVGAASWFFVEVGPWLIKTVPVLIEVGGYSFLACAAFALLSEHILDPLKPRMKASHLVVLSRIEKVLGIVAIVVLVPSLLAGLGFGAKALGTYILKQPPALGGTLALVGGVLFFWFRTKARACYGFLEMVVGVALGSSRYASEVHATAKSDVATTVHITIVMLSAGIYLVVRGLDNIREGMKEPKDALAMRIIGILSKPLTDDSD